MFGLETLRDLSDLERLEDAGLLSRRALEQDATVEPESQALERSLIVGNHFLVVVIGYGSVPDRVGLSFRNVCDSIFSSMGLERTGRSRKLASRSASP